MTEKTFTTQHFSMHGFDESISMTLAPLSVIYLKFAPAVSKKNSDNEKNTAQKAVKVKKLRK